MILAFDTYYYDTKAKTVCLAFEHWEAEQPLEVLKSYKHDVAEYTPGEFYKRELPCILDLFHKLPYKEAEAIVVDGFVYLDDEQKLGLGGYLYEALDKKIPVIGVAKTNFASLTKYKNSLLRGESQKPLYITAIGVDLDTATEHIKQMAGDYRIPKLLKELDQETKDEPE
jgi:exodeoxyribonuclease-5/deoxyribonuclease V